MNRIRVLGLISDTHGLMRPEALRALAGTDLILHAGDIGKPEILENLRELAEVLAVRGNVDRGVWAATLPETAVSEAGPARIYMLHDLGRLNLDLAAAGFDIVISGHSHKPLAADRGGVLYVNPGSAGPRRFRLPVTVARMDLATRPWKVEFVDVAGEPPHGPC